MKLKDLNFRVWDNGKYHYPIKINKDGIVDINMSIGLDDEIELFTGQYDHNSKEIYEGDILQYINSNDRYVVRYEKRYSTFYLVNINDEGDTISIDEYYMDNYEIIGNIHENKNLLKGDKND